MPEPWGGDGDFADTWHKKVVNDRASIARPHPVRHASHVFTVYALKVDRLELPANATASLVGFMVDANALGHACFSALYGR